MSATPAHRFSWIKRFPLIGPLLGLFFVTVLFEVMVGVKRAEGFAHLFPFEANYNWLTPYTIGAILTQTVIVATGALGMTMIIVSGGIDLSPGSMIALTGTVAAVFLKNGHSSVVALLAAVLVGGLFGMINGSVIAGFRMLPFIVTLGMMGIARGMAKWIGDNATVNYDFQSTEGLNLLMNNPDTLGGHDLPLWVPPIGVLILLALTILMSIILNRSVFGRHVFALGSNEDTARLCGLRTRALKITVYGLAGLFVGLAGVLQMARLRQGDPTSAMGKELDIIAAVVIGGASLNGGVGSIWGSVIGALMMTTLRNGTDNMGWENYVQDIIIGLVIVLAVGLDKLRSRGLKG